MAYATKAMLASEAKIGTEFSTATLPTAAKVDEIIAEVEAEIDARIGRKYTLPVAGEANLLIVRSISIALCVERIRAIIDSAAPVEEGKPDPSAVQKSLAKGARARLQEIVDGSLPLSMDLRSSTDGIRSYAVSNGYEPVLKRGKVQW